MGCCNTHMTIERKMLYEESMEKKLIITNKIKCRKCGDIIESISVHDFVELVLLMVNTSNGLENVKTGKN